MKLFPVIYRREGKHGVFIKLLITESDEALMPASIMPMQISGWHPKCQTVIQNAVQILNIQVIFIYCIPGKEAGRRHLIGITYDNRIFASCQYTHGFTGGEL